MSRVTISHESARGCGFRKKGGLYLVSLAPGRPCGKLPIPLAVCPTCGEGIKPARGWTWVDADALAAQKECESDTCGGCPLAGGIGRAGLIWIGERFYPTVASYMREANSMGISRRITAVPHGFKVGETWVLLAHRKCIMEFGDKFTPGIFRAFRSERIEYVVKGDETGEELDALEKRGFSLVDVRSIGPGAEEPEEEKDAMP